MKKRRRKKVFTWVLINKEWLFSGVGITIFSILFSIFTKSTQNTSEINDIGIDDKENINRKELVMSESKYLEYLQSYVDEDVLVYYYNDYDGDGTCEMFALTGEEVGGFGPEGSYDYEGKIWYINQDGLIEVESNELEYMKLPYIFSVDKNIFIVFYEAYLSTDVAYIWGVKDGKPYQPNISGRVSGLKLNEYGEIEVIDSAYDMAYDKNFDLLLGHTWKKYYFYFDGYTFREYGGIKIKIEDLMKIPEAEHLINEIYNQQYVIDTIYYRENETISINISREDNETIMYYNITIRRLDDGWYIVSTNLRGTDYGEGFYLDAFIPSIATYPEVYPY